MGGVEAILDGFPNVESFLYSQSGNLFPCSYNQEVDPNTYKTH